MYLFGFRRILVEDELYQSVLRCHMDFEEALVAGYMLEIAHDLLPGSEENHFEVPFYRGFVLGFFVYRCSHDRLGYGVYHI